LTGGYIATNISLHSRRKRFKPKIPLPKKMRKYISQEFKSTKNIQRNKAVGDSMEISCDNKITKAITSQYKKSSALYVFCAFKFL
jgi:hypothetical protein